MQRSLAPGRKEGGAKKRAAIIEDNDGIPGPVKKEFWEDSGAHIHQEVIG